MEYSLFLKAWGIVAVLMTALWLVQAKTKNASFVDIGWTLGLGICATVYAWQSQGLLLRKVLLLAIVYAWALRLLWLLVKRLQKDFVEDSRYRKIREDWKTGQNLKFFWMFHFQGALDVFLSWPFFLICFDRRESLTVLEVIGCLICVAGLIGESISDWQLKIFKEKTSNKGKICDEGLWYYSRHPNYFFEWLIWVGYFIFALDAPWGPTAIIAPIAMFYILMHVSGVPLAEAQALRTKGEAYRRYQESTSIFVPLPKKRLS